MKGFFLGTPLPPNEPGSICENCWGPDKPFGPGPSPKYVKVNIRDVQVFSPYEGDAIDIPNGTWFLRQTVDPCIWKFESGNVVCLWETHFAYSHVFFQSNTHVLFSTFYMPICQRFFVNDYFFPDEPSPLGGWAMVTWDMTGL